MKNPLLLLALTALLWAGCGSVPLTGRRQLLLVSDQEVLSSSLTQYNDYMKTAPRSSSAKQAAMVKRVGQKIAQATEAYLRQNGLAAEVKNFQWEFNLVADDQVNAFCMPGGKIVVYEGLMKLVTSDDELAVVIGHEVAHAVAKPRREERRHPDGRLHHLRTGRAGGRHAALLAQARDGGRLHGPGADAHGGLQPRRGCRLLAEDVGLGQRLRPRTAQHAPQRRPPHQRHPEGAAGD